jgi:hypothetical protein
VASNFGNAITGWLLNEITAKATQPTHSTIKTYTLKKWNGEIVAEAPAQPKALFFTPKGPSHGPASPGYFTIPLGRKRPVSPDVTVVVEELEDELDKVGGSDEEPTIIDLPRPPPPARTSPSTKQPPQQTPKKFIEALPIAPKQLLPPLDPKPTKTLGKRKPTPIAYPEAPSPLAELSNLPSSIQYTSVLDSPPSQSAPTAPLVPSSPRFAPEQPPPHKLTHRRFHRTSSDRYPQSDNPVSSHKLSAPGGFTFDFAPVVHELLPHRATKIRKQQLLPKEGLPPRDGHGQKEGLSKRQAGATECMRSFVEEYVRMRRRNMSALGREARFPVAGQMMCVTDGGSVYAYVERMRDEKRHLIS